MIQFDIHTRQDWKKRGVTSVTLDLVSAGCDGTEMRLSEGERSGFLPLEVSDSDTRCYIDPSKKDILNIAYITQVRGKWIIKSDEILTRCVCGKSFSLKTGNMRVDKITLLRSKLAKKPKHVL